MDTCVASFHYPLLHYRFGDPRQLAVNHANQMTIEIKTFKREVNKKPLHKSMTCTYSCSQMNRAAGWTI